MEINFNEMSPAEIKDFIHDAKKALQEIEKTRLQKSEEALHSLFTTLDVLGMRLRDYCTGEILEETDFYLEFIYGVENE